MFVYTHAQTHVYTHTHTLTEQAELEEMMGMLSQGLAVIKHEQEYMEVRERIHRMSKYLETVQRSKVNATIISLYHSQ